VVLARSFVLAPVGSTLTSGAGVTALAPLPAVPGAAAPCPGAAPGAGGLVRTGQGVSLLCPGRNKGPFWPQAVSSSNATISGVQRRFAPVAIVAAGSLSIVPI